jgi:hypothetical protein
MYFQEIDVSDFLSLKKKLVNFSLRDLEEITLSLLTKSEDIEWGIHEQTQSFNIGYWSNGDISYLLGREVKTSTTHTTTTINPEDGTVIVRGEPLKSNKNKPLKYKISLFKCEDDWFLVQIFINSEFRYHDEGFWIKADQLDGAIDFIENLFKYCPVFNYKRIDDILNEIITNNKDTNKYLSYIRFNVQEDMWFPVNNPQVLPMLGIPGEQGIPGNQGISVTQVLN